MTDIERELRKILAIDKWPFSEPLISSLVALIERTRAEALRAAVIKIATFAARSDVRSFGQLEYEVLALIPTAARLRGELRVLEAVSEEAYWWAKAHGYCEQPTETCRWIHERIATNQAARVAKKAEIAAEEGKVGK